MDQGGASGEVTNSTRRTYSLRVVRFFRFLESNTIDHRLGRVFGEAIVRHRLLAHDHTVEYVVALCQKVFGYPVEKGLQIAEEVHFTNRCILWTGALELAELKQEQIHSLGKDELVNHCMSCMSAILEPAA